MKIFKRSNIKFKRKYLRLAATYRRFSDRNNPFWDFSISALEECFNHESHGAEYSRNNGYINGKHNKDITMAMWIEDLKSGDIVKAELYSLVNKWWLIPALEFVTVPTRYVYKYITVVGRNGARYGPR